MKNTTSNWAKIKSSGIHNKGIFATRDIPKGTKIIEYVGEKLTKKQSDKRADEITELHEKNKDYGAVYIFEVNKRHDIDGSVKWNTARYINHSCDPNCESDIIKEKVWIIALKDIKKGEELTYDYGYDIDDYESHPCKCGAKNCAGYIVAQEDWPKLRRRLAYKKKKKKFISNPRNTTKQSIEEPFFL